MTTICRACALRVSKSCPNCAKLSHEARLDCTKTYRAPDHRLPGGFWRAGRRDGKARSEEHTSELQSHSFISYAVFCLNKNARHIRVRTGENYLGQKADACADHFN